jgi:hypothetical protein
VLVMGRTLDELIPCLNLFVAGYIKISTWRSNLFDSVVVFVLAAFWASDTCAGAKSIDHENYTVYFLRCTIDISNMLSTYSQASTFLLTTAGTAPAFYNKY